MRTFLHLCRRGRLRLSAWIARHPWIGLIVASLVARIAHTIFENSFSFFFPVLSTVLYSTFERMLPVFSFASGLFLFAVLGLLLAITLFGRASGRRTPAQPPFTGRRLAIAVLTIAGCAGAALVDGYLAYGTVHRTERADLP